MIAGRVAAVVALAGVAGGGGGCRAILGIDDVEASFAADAPDKGFDADTDRSDARPADAALSDAADCGDIVPAGCTAFGCPGSSSCYYVCTMERSWDMARGQCDMAGGCLVTIDDQNEQDCIVDATDPTFPDVVWFGFVQDSAGVEPAGGWGWACGSSVYVAPNWGGVEPNDEFGEDCGAMTLAGGWIDAQCTSTARYVCEHPPP